MKVEYVDVRIYDSENRIGLRPQGDAKFFYRKMCKCTPRTRSAPRSRSRSQFLVQFLLGGLDLEVYLDVL